MQTALDRYRELIRLFPDSTEARYARIHIRNICREVGSDVTAAPLARIPPLDNAAAGEWLKQQVATEGRFVAVRLSGVHDTVLTLASFFRGQQREWVAVCLLDDAHTCHLIWLNGGSRHEVRVRFGVETFVHRISPYVGTRNILVAHNHPVPASDSRLRFASFTRWATRFNIGPLSRFSELDRASAEAWRSYCRSNGLGYAEVLYVDRSILIKGNQALVDDWRAHCPPPQWRLLSALAPLISFAGRL